MTDCHRADVKQVIQSFLDGIIDELGKGNRLEFRDFGVLESKSRAARIAQNPKTLERVSVPAKKTVKFKVGRLLKERLDDGPQGKPSIVIQPGIGPDGKVHGGKSRSGHGSGKD